MDLIVCNSIRRLLSGQRGRYYYSIVCILNHHVRTMYNVCYAVMLRKWCLEIICMCSVQYLANELVQYSVDSETFKEAAHLSATHIGVHVCFLRTRKQMKHKVRCSLLYLVDNQNHVSISIHQQL